MNTNAGWIDENRLSPGRTTAMAAAIALNASMALFLSIPAAREAVIRIATKADEPVINIEHEPKPVVVVDQRNEQTPPIQTPITPPVEKPERIEVTTVSTTVVDGPVLNPDPNPVTGDPDPATTVIANTGASAPVGQYLEYLEAPLNYNSAMLRAGVEGEMMLRVVVGTDGRPESVELARSSGNRVLDREVIKQVKRNWLFRPATQDGVAIRATGLVPIRLTLASG